MQCCLHVPSVQARVLEQLFEGGQTGFFANYYFTEEAALQGDPSLPAAAPDCLLIHKNSRVLQELPDNPGVAA